MSALSHKQTFREGRPMSALPPKADITAAQTNVRFVPEADKCNAANEFLLGRSAPCYSQLSSLISFGQGAPLPVSRSDLRLSRKTAHLVLQWCMNSTGSFQPSCLKRTMIQSPSCLRSKRIFVPSHSWGPSTTCQSTRLAGWSSRTFMSKPPSPKRNLITPPTWLSPCVLVVHQPERTSRAVN